MRAHPWAIAADEVIEALGAHGERGLDRREAERRLEEHGVNRLRRIEHRSVWGILWDQVKSMVVLLLVAAAAVAMAMQQWTDAAAIGVVVLINTAIGFFTELRARRSMEALQTIGEGEVQVVRGGRKRRLSAEALVPGDLLLLGPQETVAADVRLLRADTLQIDESALTGESVPVDKQPDPVDDDAPLAERTDMAFRGTRVTRGSGRGVVVATAMDTEIGRVSALVEQAEGRDTPLEKRLHGLARRLVWLTLAIAAVVVGLGLAAGRDTFMMVETGIALAVAAIPEGLPIVATVALARGVQRMLRRNALIRRLSSVETLGSTNVICSDKTGTLTENRMIVARVVTASGESDFREGEGGDPERDDLLRRAIEIGVLCNQASLGDGEGEEGGQGERGDPMELALLQLGRRTHLDRERLLEDAPQARLEPFDHDTKMMASFHRQREGHRVVVKGAPEAVLDASSSQLGPDGTEELDEVVRRQWRERSESHAAGGLRLLALAEKTVPNEDATPYADLTFVGLVGLFDPPREEVPRAVRQCRDAGIDVVMVTGDHPATARAIARQVSILDEGDDNHPVVEGRDFGDDERRLIDARVLARVNPEQKLQLIDAHQNAGRTVAMTGDGVNDAPALKSADIGVAMGQRGTEVAREAADMVLLDDAFETIGAAVEQGRIIFDNIRKFVIYLLSGNVGEVLAVAAAALTAAPLPLMPLQILYLNMLNDVFPALALGVGRGSGDVMRRPPRAPGEAIVTRAHWTAIGLYGVLIAGSILAVFFLSLLWLELGKVRAITVSFLTLSIGRLLHAFNMRDARTGFFHNDVVKNPWMWGAIALCVGLLMLAVYVPPLARILTLTHPGREGWALVAVGSVIPLLVGQSYLAIRGAAARR
ncbi:MAG: cation-translocating P-type ATPase [Myxococcota bacterium]